MFIYVKEDTTAVLIIFSVSTKRVLILEVTKLVYPGLGCNNKHLQAAVLQSALH